jgi:predicted nucleotidyltransferase
VLDASIVAAVQNYLRMLQQHSVVVRFAVVFGSQVTGTTNSWSDIDLLVVSPQFDTAYDHRLVDLLWRVSARVDSRIEPIPCGEHQWEEGDASAIVEIARRHGERVTASA